MKLSPGGLRLVRVTRVISKKDLDLKLDSLSVNLVLLPYSRQNMASTWCKESAMGVCRMSCNNNSKNFPNEWYMSLNFFLESVLISFHPINLVLSLGRSKFCRYTFTSLTWISIMFSLIIFTSFSSAFLESCFATLPHHLLNFQQH